MEYLAPCPNGGLNEAIRSLNVSDTGNFLVYEDGGTVNVLTESRQGRRQTARHPGQFPALMPDRAAYVYVDHGWLILKENESTRELLPVADVVGAIRISPDGRFVAFGISTRRESS